MKILFLLPFVFVGCAINRPHMNETVFGYDTNGVLRTKTVRDLKVPTYSILTSTETLAKQKVFIGKTMSVGTEGLNQEAISTNGLAALIELRKIADDAAKISNPVHIPIP